MKDTTFLIVITPFALIAAVCLLYVAAHILQ